MNVKQLYEYTARFLTTQASYCCTSMKESPWILGAGMNSITICPGYNKKGIFYRVEIKVLSYKYGYELESCEQYRIFKYARKQKRAL